MFNLIGGPYVRVFVHYCPCLQLYLPQLVTALSLRWVR